MRTFLSVTALLGKSAVELTDTTRIVIRNINLNLVITEKHIQSLQTSLNQLCHLFVVVKRNLVKQMNTITTVSTDRLLKTKILQSNVNLIAKIMSCLQFFCRR